MRIFKQDANLLAEMSILLKTHMARAIHEQKESCAAAVLRMVLNSYVRVSGHEVTVSAKRADTRGGLDCK